MVGFLRLSDPWGVIGKGRVGLLRLRAKIIMTTRKNREQGSRFGG